MNKMKIFMLAAFLSVSGSLMAQTPLQEKVADKVEQLKKPVATRTVTTTSQKNEKEISPEIQAKRAERLKNNPKKAVQPKTKVFTVNRSTQSNQKLKAEMKKSVESRKAKRKIDSKRPNPTKGKKWSKTTK